MAASLINHEAEVSFYECQKLYNKYNVFYKIFPFDEAQLSKISSHFNDIIIEAVNCAAPKKMEVWDSKFTKDLKEYTHI